MKGMPHKLLGPAAMILARAGSKSIVRKNLRHLGPAPLITWILTTVCQCRAIRHAVVVSDDPQIRDIASRKRMTVLAEPDELASDTVGDLPVMRWALRRMGVSSGIIAHLRATSPFVRPADIESAIRMLVDHPTLTAVRSVKRAKEHPRKMYREGPAMDGVPTLTPYTGPAHHGGNMPRQILEPVWLAAGYVDVFRAEVILGPDGPEGAMIGLWETPRPRLGAEEANHVVDLDTEADWRRAEETVARRQWTPARHIKDGW